MPAAKFRDLAVPGVAGSVADAISVGGRIGQVMNPLVLMVVLLLYLLDLISRTMPLVTRICCTEKFG